jgi:hypothetical protein
MTHKPRLKPAAHRRVTPRVNAEYIGPAALVPTAVAAMLLLFGLFYFGGPDERTTINNAGEQIQRPAEIKPEPICQVPRSHCVRTERSPYGRGHRPWQRAGELSDVVSLSRRAGTSISESTSSSLSILSDRSGGPSL